MLAIKGLEGIVLVGLGDGNIPSDQGDFLRKARAKGIVVVGSSYVGFGKVTHNYNNLDDKFDLVSSGTLSPEKAGIFLQLCLKRIIFKRFKNYSIDFSKLINKSCFILLISFLLNGDKLKEKNATTIMSNTYHQKELSIVI